MELVADALARVEAEGENGKKKNQRSPHGETNALDWRGSGGKQNLGRSEGNIFEKSWGQKGN